MISNCSSQLHHIQGAAHSGELAHSAMPGTDLTEEGTSNNRVYNTISAIIVPRAVILECVLETSGSESCFGKARPARFGLVRQISRRELPTSNLFASSLPPDGDHHQLLYACSWYLHNLTIKPETFATAFWRVSYNAPVDHRPEPTWAVQCLPYETRRIWQPSYHR